MESLLCFISKETKTNTGQYRTVRNEKLRSRSVFGRLRLRTQAAASGIKEAFRIFCLRYICYKPQNKPQEPGISLIQNILNIADRYKLPVINICEHLFILSFVLFLDNAGVTVSYYFGSGSTQNRPAS